MLVYLSSTYLDLIAERDAAIYALEGLQHTVMAMEKYFACDERPLDKCIQDVRACDAYVGILGWRYGFRPEGQTKSITELEYSAAVDGEKKRLMFLLQDDPTRPSEFRDSDPADVEAVRLFRQEAAKDRIRSEFRSIPELTKKMHLAVHSTLGIGRTIPLLKPYLADRSEQESKLDEALEAHQERLLGRPLVCVVVGNEHAVHEMFFRRLREKTLPTRLERSEMLTHHELVNLPDSMADEGGYHKRLLAKLAEMLVHQVPQPVEKIRDAINASPGPVVLKTDLVCEAGNVPQVRRTVQHFLSFWQKFPDLHSSVRLLAFLSIKERARRPPGLWHWLRPS